MNIFPNMIFYYNYYRGICILFSSWGIAFISSNYYNRKQKHHFPLPYLVWVPELCKLWKHMTVFTYILFSFPIRFPYIHGTQYKLPPEMGMNMHRHCGFAMGLVCSLIVALKSFVRKNIWLSSYFPVNSETVTSICNETKINCNGTK